MSLNNVSSIIFITEDRSKESLKIKKLKRLTIEYDIDAIYLTEINTDWRAVQQQNTICNSTSG